MALDASSMRWLARPTRCSRRETPFGRADLDHLVDAAPVDAEIQRGGRHHRAQAARGHRGFDLAALLDFQGAVVEGDRQRRVVQLPQRLEHQFGLGAGVDEDDGHAGVSDVRHDLGGGFQAHVAGPGQAALRQDHLKFGRGAVGDLDASGGAGVGLDRVGVGDGGGQADAAGAGRQGAQAGDAERELVAALGAGQRMDLVHDDAGEGCRRTFGASGSESRTARLSGVVSKHVRRGGSSGGRGGWRGCRRCGPRW